MYRSHSLIQSVGEVLISFISSSPHGVMNASALKTGPGFHRACGTVAQPVRAALIPQSVARWILIRETRVLGCGNWRRGLEQATHAQLLRSTQPMDYE